jgi:hypothetical protein
MLVYKKQNCQMESQVPSSQPQQQITPEMLEQLKKQAKELAIQQALQQRLAFEQNQVQQQMQPPAQSKTVKTPLVNNRRNLTVAEIILMFAISCGLVFGVQSCWNYATNILPKIEIKVQK